MSVSSVKIVKPLAAGATIVLSAPDLTPSGKAAKAEEDRLYEINCQEVINMIINGVDIVVFVDSLSQDGTRVHETLNKMLYMTGSFDLDVISVFFSYLCLIFLDNRLNILIFISTRKV
jgi:hypothetical protein